MIAIYVAAPIVGIDKQAKMKITLVKQILEQKDKIVLYDPSENGVPNAWGMSMEEWGRSIFTLDVKGIDQSDWIVVCDFGRSGTAGTAWECGYAFGQGKKVLVIQMSEDTDYSVMMRGCSSNYCTYDEFIDKDDPLKFMVERGRISQLSGAILN